MNFFFLELVVGELFISVGFYKYHSFWWHWYKSFKLPKVMSSHLIEEGFLACFLTGICPLHAKSQLPVGRLDSFCFPVSIGCIFRCSLWIVSNTYCIAARSMHNVSFQSLSSTTNLSLLFNPCVWLFRLKKETI